MDSFLIIQYLFEVSSLKNVIHSAVLHHLNPFNPRCELGCQEFKGWAVKVNIYCHCCIVPQNKPIFTVIYKAIIINQKYFNSCQDLEGST